MSLSIMAAVSVFQPTLPARGATVMRFAFSGRAAISTHAPRTGSDQARIRIDRKMPISTHAPRTGSDSGGGKNSPPPQKFQPTLPARGATQSERRSRRFTANFNPRSPHGERLHRRRM